MKRARIFKYWNRIRSSFWFVPALMAVGAVVLAVVTVAVDPHITGWFEERWEWAFTGGPEGATAVLTTVATSMITIAGVVFSMTLVALTLASSQLGPRLLRNFMRDTPTQVVLGSFIAAFLYSLFVLRTLRREEDVAFVPHIAVGMGVLVGVASVGVLIYFIHHVSVSIQANQVVARVGRELIRSFDVLFPEHVGNERNEGPAAVTAATFLGTIQDQGQTVEASGDGYLAFIDGESLVELASEADVTVSLERRPGEYVVKGIPLARVWPADRVDQDFQTQLNDVCVLGKQRTNDQDIAFPIHQLVEVAVRALSPGINDPFTAMACVDQLGSGLCRLARRDWPSAYRYDDEGRLRVIAPAPDFPFLVGASFDQIRHYGRSSSAVTVRLLETLTLVAGFVRRPEDGAALLHQGDMILRGTQEGLPEPADRAAAESVYQELRSRLKGDPD